MSRWPIVRTVYYVGYHFVTVSHYIHCTPRAMYDDLFHICMQYRGALHSRRCTNCIMWGITLSMHPIAPLLPLHDMKVVTHASLQVSPLLAILCRLCVCVNLITNSTFVRPLLYLYCLDASIAAALPSSKCHTCTASSTPEPVKTSDDGVASTSQIRLFNHEKYIPAASALPSSQVRLLTRRAIDSWVVGR